MNQQEQSEEGEAHSDAPDEVPKSKIRAHVRTIVLSCGDMEHLLRGGSIDDEMRSDDAQVIGMSASRGDGLMVEVYDPNLPPILADHGLNRYSSVQRIERSSMEISSRSDWEYSASTHLGEIGRDYKGCDMSPGLTNTPAILALALQFITDHCDELEWINHCREYYKDLTTQGEAHSDAPKSKIQTQVPNHE